MSIRSFPIAAAVVVGAGAQPGTVDGPTIDLLDSATFPTDPFIQEYRNAAVTATDASPGVFTWTGFPGINGDVAVIEAGAPGGFVNGEAYFVVNATTNTFDLSHTKGGTAITTTSTGTAVSVILEHNEGGGTGVTSTPGAPFLPGYSAVLFMNLSNTPADITATVEGSDDSTNWNTVGTLTAAGSLMVRLSGQTVNGDTTPLYQYLRYKFVGSATAAAGTLNAFLLGDG